MKDGTTGGFGPLGNCVTWIFGHKVAALGLVPKWLISAIARAIRKTSKLVPSRNSVLRYNKNFAPI